MNSLLRLGFLCLFIFLTSCSNYVVPKLRVGVSPDYPPIIYKDGGQIVGVEADFAHALALELGMEVEFVELPWNMIIPALNQRHIDIIMSGMSVTEERSQLVNFSDSYFSISQMLLVRKNEMGMFRKPGRGYYVRSGLTVGVATGTTGENLVKQYLPENRIISFPNVSNGTLALKSGKIDCFLHDAPTIWRYADGSDPQLAGVYWEIGKENLAWAISKNNPNLLRDIRKITEKWRFNGTSAKIVTKWIPTRVTYK